ncbi:MAG: capsule assembly Wzi family protein [Bacteroidota bacterium]|mgnify:FL=1
MIFPRRLFLTFSLVTLISFSSFGQVETVPAAHPVYTFLKRMEVKGIIERYHDAILPLSRREVGKFLLDVQKKSEQLTLSERNTTTDFLSEFQYDIGGSIDGFLSVVNSSEPSFGDALSEEFSNREKFLYALKDSSVTMFVNGLLTFDARRIRGDALGSDHSEFIQFGGRIRGTIFDKLGYYLQGTNAQFWGSRELLERDPVLGQNYTLLTATDAQNFDFSEGYARYDAGIVSVQFGKERMLWGTGYDQKMIASDNVRTYDFLRADFQYKALKYTFFHGSLLGRRSALTFKLPSDTTVSYTEPTAADKYFAAHRIEFSFPHLVDVGFQEMAIYSNRSIDFAYLNPFIVLESAQRSREERDNVLWAFDIQTHFMSGLELNATIVFDDLHFGEFFEPRWYNRYAYQAGFMLTDPLFIPNATLMVEYTRVKPFVYAHDRSREDSYTSLNAMLGPRIGPNADSWFVRADYFPLRNLTFSLRVTLVRHGENRLNPDGTIADIYNADGTLRQSGNVGGDVFQGHRSKDPLNAHFLDGIVLKSRTIQFLAMYEIVNQIWLDGWLQSDSEENTSNGVTDKNTTFGARLRMEL